jgi:hypothetical protein
VPVRVNGVLTIIASGVPQVRMEDGADDLEEFGLDNEDGDFEMTGGERQHCTSTDAVGVA